MTGNKQITDVWCSETGHIGITNNGIDKKFTGTEFEKWLNELVDENDELRNNLEDWIQRTLKAHEYFNLLEEVIDEVCNDDISNEIWKVYEERERLIDD